MGKYTIQHLADILVKKNGLADNEAQNFVNGIFEVIKMHTPGSYPRDLDATGVRVVVG